MSESTNEAEQLELRYVPLSQVSLWDQNPKLHDIDALIRSIDTHGFGDPPKYDSALPGVVYGNGRIEALKRMQGSGCQAPRGIVVLNDGSWVLPIIFGCDTASREAATAFAIDHNNLSLLGGKLDFHDLLAIWDEEGLQRVLEDAPGAADLLASFNEEDIAALLAGPEFEAARADEQSKLDQKKTVRCPECGNEFTP